MDPEGREEVLELTRDLSRNKGMSLLFSSHLLPDVESVCDHIMVLAKGRLLAEGRIETLKQRPEGHYEIRVRGDQERFRATLAGRGVSVEAFEDRLRVQLPPGADISLLWEHAQSTGEQIRMIRPRQTTLEEVFFNALGETEKV